MIKLKLKDKKLLKSSKVRAWTKSCEDILNKEFPPERLDKMCQEIASDLMLYGSYVRDENNNRISPERWPIFDEMVNIDE